MRKISSKGIQTFVAGAVALSGFNALIQAPRELLIVTSVITVGGSIVSSSGLLIGIAILCGGERAVFWARIYLLLSISCWLFMLFLPVFRVLPDEAWSISWWSAPDLLAPTILFALLGWSRSKRFKDESVA
jgi:hypothetical protein